MKQLRMILWGSVFFLFPLYILGNNIQINFINTGAADVSLGVNHPANFIPVQFGLQWENSWRVSTSTNNWDAAWVFMKFRKKGGIWQHAHLHTGGHTGPLGCMIEASADGVGAMVYRSQNGNGGIQFSPISLRWNYGADSLGDHEVFDLRIFVIEMVYIPGGSFQLGEASSPSARGSFKNANNTSAFPVNSENAVILGGSAAGSLTAQNPAAMLNADDFNSTSTKILSDSFPKGFAGFYCMKYEISQQQYTDFLNLLTYPQQVSRTSTPPSGLPASGALSATNANRNGIDIIVSGISPNQPAEYVCNLNNPGLFGTETDGQWIACNFLKWSDIAAYLDWSGLRPMTEWEYEKVCRGSLPAVTSEYAWGNTTYTTATNISNNGSITEKSNNNSANVNCCNSGNILGPMRTGCMARPTGSRVTGGSSFYGVMDLSGNVSEMVVSCGNATGRAFRRRTGDGVLTGSGDANVNSWPPSNGSGCGHRGGSWQEQSTFLRLADRYYGNSPPGTRQSTIGGRGVR